LELGKWHSCTLFDGELQLSICHYRNKKEKEMSFDRKQRFSIRKYSVGVASVLIGTVLAGTTIAAADTEVKVDEASSSSTSVASESLVEEAAPVAETEKVATYTAEPAIPSPSLTPVEKNEEAVASEKTTEAPAKEVAEVEKKANVVEAKVEEAKKEAKTDTKVEEAKKESQSAPTVEEAESKAVVSEKAKVEASEAVEDKASETAAPSVKDKIVVDKKVPGLDLENATVNPNGGYDIQLTKEAQEKFRASLEAYIARRRNYNRRGSFRAAGDATSTDPDYEFKKVMTPVLPGFYADKASIEALVVDPTNIDDYVFNVWYKKLGYVTYVDEQGNYITPAGEVTSKQEESARKQYANDPSDPTRAWFTNVPSVPTGWEIKPGQSIYGYDETRKTVNPNHKDDLDAIGRDTKIVITKQIQKAIIKYVNEKGNTELSRDLVSGKSGELINYSTNDKISSYRRQGYELVSDGFSDAADKNFDSDTKVDQEFTVTLRERIEPIDPDKPKPNPDQPVDPKDPDTPKWPDPVKDVVNKDDVTRTVKYVYEDGSKAKDDVTETLHFKRFAYVNLVTGHIDYREWTTSDDTFDAVKSPVISGYTANKLVVPEVKGVKAGAEDIVEVVTYAKDAQKAIIKYVNEKGNVEVTRDVVNGKSGEAINYSTSAKIDDLHRKGYELVSDGFTSAANKNFDFDAKVDQEFTVVVRERIVPVGPNDPNPTPDTPYDPTDPKTPNWPKTVDKIQPRRITGTRTVYYYVEDGDGVPVPKPVRERVVFERIVLVNLVTGEMTPQAWKFVSATPIEDDAANRPAVRTRRALTDAITPRGVEASLASDTPRFRARSARLEDEETEVTALAADVSSNSEAVLPPIPSPVVPGHYTLVKEIESTTIDPDGTLNYKFDVYYKKLGRIQLVDKDGKVLSEVVYKNNLTDASRADVTPVPEIPAAYKIKDGQKVFGYDTTAGTVDPNDPADPNAIGRNTTIVVEQKSVARQETKVVTETIFYKDALTGEVLAPEHKDQVTFHREVVVNPVTNEVLSTGEWTAENADTTFDAVTSPVLEGYTANPLVVEEVTGLTAESKDVVATVLYTKNPAPTPEPKPEPQPQPQPQPRPQPQPEPVKPEPEKPQPVKQEPAKPEAPVTPQAPALPETGEDQSVSAALFGAALGMVGLAGLAKRKKQED